MAQCGPAAMPALWQAGMVREFRDALIAVDLAAVDLAIIGVMADGGLRMPP